MIKIKKYKCPTDVVDFKLVANYWKSKVKDLGTSDANEIDGNISSMMGRDYFMLPFIKLFPKLYEWFQSCIDSFCEENNYNSKALTLHRFWINEMSNGSQIKVHNHFAKGLVCVLVFYLYSEKDSGNLVILEDTTNYIEDKDKLKLLEEFFQNKKQYIPVETGDLIIHDATIPHAVAKWEGSEPRLSMVIEFMTANGNTNS